MLELDIPIEGLRIALGCGQHTTPGWFCIDAAQHPLADRALDMQCDVRQIPLPDECAAHLVAIHLWEHLYRWECDEVIVEWRRLLRMGGKLTMEMPDLMKFCHNVLIGRNDGKHPDQYGLWGMYGDPTTRDPLMVHKWGWTFRTLRKFLKHHGFGYITEEETQWHPAGHGIRDFRIMAVKV